jgi:hypothetical protein
VGGKSSQRTGSARAATVAGSGAVCARAAEEGGHLNRWLGALREAVCERPVTTWPRHGDRVRRCAYGRAANGRWRRGRPAGGEASRGSGQGPTSVMHRSASTWRTDCWSPAYFGVRVRQGTPATDVARWRRRARVLAFRHENVSVQLRLTTFFSRFCN